MKIEHIIDKTWPVCVSTQSIYSRWYNGESTIDVDVSFVLEPRYVPIEIQSIQLCYTGDWFYGVDFVTSEKAPQFVGQQLDTMEQTGPHTAHFKIPAPEDRNFITMTPALVVDALGLPCMVDLDAIKLVKQK